MINLFRKLFKLKIKKCPFCGNIPEYNKQSQLVRCSNLDCAIHSWFIHIDEWNKRK